MSSNSNLFHGPGDLNNAQHTEIRDKYKNQIPVDVVYLTSHWW